MKRLLTTKMNLNERKYITKFEIAHEVMPKPQSSST